MAEIRDSTGKEVVEKLRRLSYEIEDINKRLFAGSIPGSDKNKKWENIVVANIEILQCLARGGPRRSLSLPKKRPESPRRIFC